MSTPEQRLHEREWAEWVRLHRRRDSSVMRLCAAVLALSCELDAFDRQLNELREVVHSETLPEYQRFSPAHEHEIAAVARRLVDGTEAPA